MADSRSQDIENFAELVEVDPKSFPLSVAKPIAIRLQETAKLCQVKPDVRLLFTGDDDNTKSLAAKTLAKQLRRPLYRVNLSAIASKYIGETEKNLLHLLKAAGGLNAILLFDEADALFGSRTTVEDSHNKYANQEVSFLFQQLEQYPGLCILAVNQKENADRTWVRRLASVVDFRR